jgi:hypothetical protein
LGTAVTIVNLGFASELIEGLALLSLLKGRYNQLQVTNEPSTISRVPTNSWAGAGRLLQGGVVAFNDNTVIQNFLDGQPSLTLSSVFVLSFDDVSVQDNTMVSHIDFASDFCLANFLGFAWSIRACGNRFEETLFRTLNSAYTLGFFNDTSHNQATHCIEAAGPAPLLIDGPNRALVQALNPLACGGCLTPPFTGLAMEARSANGALVTPRLHSFAGMSGLWFASSLLITLPGEVEEVELSFAGEDVQLRVAAERANGQIVREAFLQLGTATTQLAGDSISRLRIEASAERAVMTRLCSERPQFGSASGAVTGSSFLSWEG